MEQGFQEDIVNAAATGIMAVKRDNQEGEGEKEKQEKEQK